VNPLRGQRSDLDGRRTDSLIDALLAARGRRPAIVADVPAEPVAAAGTRLAAELVPIHPSFRFEEALASRLAAAARGASLPAAAGAEGTALSFVPAGPAIDDLLADIDEVARVPARPRGRLIGGAALTSAALSLAGAAFVAWRRSRAPGRPDSPLARAARAAHRTRRLPRVIAPSVD
jgi:hypothetical protein